MARSRFRTALALLAAGVGAAGCAAAPPKPPPDAGKAYQAGYADGCSSGQKPAEGKSFARARGQIPRGRVQSESDLLYVRGWAAGHDTSRSLALSPGWDI